MTEIQNNQPKKKSFLNLTYYIYKQDISCRYITTDDVPSRNFSIPRIFVIIWIYIYKLYSSNIAGVESYAKENIISHNNYPAGERRRIMQITFNGFIQDQIYIKPV